MPNNINLPACTNQWSERERNLFTRLDIYLAKTQAERLKWHGRWPKLLKGVPWRANQGVAMQGVRKVPSPILRSQALPNKLTQPPLKDVIEPRELSEQAELYRHNFDSELLHFLPNFQDFLTDHVDYTMEDMTEKTAIYLDLFYRTAIFHASPKVWVCGKATEVTSTDYWTGSTIELKKSQAQLQALVAEVKKPLDLDGLSKLATVAYSDLRIPPYSGSVLPDGTDGRALMHKYCLLMGTECWENFRHDDYVLDNKRDSLDVVTDGFTGSLFGRFTSLHEYYELRIASDGTIPAPEELEGNSSAYNYGEPVLTDAYKNAPVGVAWLCGADGYKYIKVGPPPVDWRNMTMRKFASLDFNGKVELTQNILVPCYDAQNSVSTFETNKRGEYLQLIATLVMGILPIRRDNVLPILYLRSRVAAS